ncbi:hypothetical protein EDB83DRAFT_1446818 [Lactarius deliciosus]|nr:hypothetical protein EDB83DRAFT_1446818 [Lactarius deliciosus]
MPTFCRSLPALCIFSGCSAYRLLTRYCACSSIPSFVAITLSYMSSTSASRHSLVVVVNSIPYLPASACVRDARTLMTA